MDLHRKTRADLEHDVRALCSTVWKLKRDAGQAISLEEVQDLITGRAAGVGDGGNGFTVRLPFGFGSFSGRGWIAIVGLVIIAFGGSLAGLLYINYRGFQALERRDDERARTIAAATQAREAQQLKTAQEHKDIGDALEAVIYVLTIPEVERRALNLERPKLIREMARR